MSTITQTKLKQFKCSGCGNPMALTDGCVLITAAGFLKRTVTISCWHCEKETTWRPRPQPVETTKHVNNLAAEPIH